MVKISVKKEKNTRKQTQKQKQKQTQKVIVNIGKEIIARKRRAPRQSLQKNSVSNKQQQTPTTVYIPQSMPVVMQPQPPNSMNEIINYLKQSEGRKQVAQEKEKNNELETDKKKDEERSKILIPEEVQDNFSNVYNSSNISSLTNSVNRISPNISGSSTPILSYPVNPQSLYESLIRIEDLNGGNPNSGNLYVVRDSETQTQTPLLSSFGTQTKKPSLSSFGTQTDKVADLITAVEDKEITETLKQLPENQLIIRRPQKTKGTSTATAVVNINPIDNTIPAFLRPINKPLPRIYAKDLIRPGTTKEQEEIMRQARISKLDKKPLQIEDEPTNIPNFTEDELNAYKKSIKEAKKAAEESKKAAEESKKAAEDDEDEDEDENKKFSYSNFTKKSAMEQMKDKINEDRLKYLYQKYILR
jgi:hypothetical protein